MKEKRPRRISALVCALVACLGLLVATLVPTVAPAQESPEPAVVTRGDVVPGFMPELDFYESSDPSVAWVDEYGTLHALKPGTATISYTIPLEGELPRTVTVNDYDDGSGIVGNLRILARYNDSMSFYDGHVYLLFTPYQDGVTVGVDDLYGMYQISDQYYRDINADISCGSNHTGTDADKYFTFTTDQNSVTLNRGEIVTIGMYRDFDLSVAQAALGSIQNSTLWTSISEAAKTDISNMLFKLIDSFGISEDEAFSQLKAICDQEGVDVNQLLDGVVAGGVCFNRELYNQKLEYDQYENVIYGTDITQDQLNTLCAALNGNLNNFSILKNSCATVALRAWNAAVGTRNGADTAYKIDATGKGIYALIDAPKSVRDAIVCQLPGYTLNNESGVEEPDASFVDDTGYVYVSAPKKVNPITFTYTDGSVVVDDARTDLAALFRAAKGDAPVVYGDNPEALVNVVTTTQGDVTTIDKIEFTMDGQTYTLDEGNMPADGVWFTVPVEGAAEGAGYHVTDADGNAAPSEYADGSVSFLATSLPSVFTVVNDGLAYSQLTTTIENDDEAKATTEVYYKKGDEKILIASGDTLPEGTQVFVKAGILNGSLTNHYVLGDVLMDDESIMGAYDLAEGAYVAVMPNQAAELKVVYEPAAMEATNSLFVQVPVGETLNVLDYVELLVGEDETPSTELMWTIAADVDGTLVTTDDPQTIQAVDTGKIALVWAGSTTNPTFGIPFFVQAYDPDGDMVKVEYNYGDFAVMQTVDDETSQVLSSGTKVPLGAQLTVVPEQSDGTVVSSVRFNHANVPAGQSFTADKDVTIEVEFRKASIKGVDSIVRLADKGDTHQLNAKVKYDDGLASILPVYDPSITYVSSNPDLVEVDATGKITVVGEVPAEGAAVIVTAYAGSSNNGVAATCKVIVGKYQGDEVVGRLTIYARPVSSEQIVPHSSVTFKAYKDVELNACFYKYYKPTEQYMDLMADYRDHPEKYTSDPALYSNNELGLDDRASYFEVVDGSMDGTSQTVSLSCGEAITLSNYGFDELNIATLMKALESSSLYTSEDVQALVEQMRAYSEGNEIDGVTAYDSLISTLAQMIAITKATGHNPADGYSEGGMTVDRELYNQFAGGNNTQTPNQFYTVEITADELACLQQYLADPANNHYGLFEKNCTTGAVDIWNATLSDRPELALSANLTGFGAEPESLYLAIGKLWRSTGKTYEPDVEGKEEGGGKDFYPRTVRCAKQEPEPEPTPEPTPEPKQDAQVTKAPAAKQLTYTGSAQALVDPGEATGGDMAYSLDGTSFDAAVPTATDAG